MAVRYRRGALIRVAQNLRWRPRTHQNSPAGRYLVRRSIPTVQGGAERPTIHRVSLLGYDISPLDLLISECIEPRYERVGVVEQSLGLGYAALVVGIHSGVFAGRVRADVLPAAQHLRALIDALGPLNITPDGLSGPVSFGVSAALKDPIAARVALHLIIEGGGPLDAAGLAGLALSHGLAALKVCRPQLEDVGHSQTGSHAQPHNGAVCWHQCREYMAHLGAGRVGGTQIITPF